MDLSVVQLLLVTGVLPAFSSVPRQYHLIKDPKSWPEAQAFCKANYVDLATVENYIDLGRLQREAWRQGFASEAWVGLYNDVKSWRCSRNDLPLGSWRKWEAGQPNNRYGKEECALIGQDGLWRDGQCSAQIPFICYDENAGLNRFVPINSGKSWKEAQAYCRLSHTDLACPSDDVQNSIVKDKAPTAMNWIGYYRDSWKWSDKTNSSNIRWSSYQPDNAGGSDDCGYVVKSVYGSSYNQFSWHFSIFGGYEGTSDGSGYGWFDDSNCADRRAFFCQSTPTPKKRQVLRVVLQSDQDVNDPSVKAALLEKIRQKLKEQGMVESPTLRWRERSDGTVFNREREESSDQVENTTLTMCEL